MEFEDTPKDVIDYLSRSDSPQRRVYLPAGRENAKVHSFCFSAPFLCALFASAVKI
jgi:hypothetical protein